MKNISFLLPLLVFCLSVSPFVAFANGLGISPGTKFVRNLLPDREYTTNVTFTRSDASERQVLDIVVEGPIAEYISAPEELVMSQGEQQVDLNFVISTGALDEGTYEAFVIGRRQAGQSETEEAGHGSQSLPGARAKIEFTVTNDEIAEFEIRQVNLQSSEEEQPLGFTYFMINTGNVDTRPDRIEFSVFDRQDGTEVYSETIGSDRVPIVKALAEENVGVLTDARIERGTYNAHVVMYKGEEIVFENDDLPFQIFPPGTLGQDGTLLSFQTDKETYRSGELVQFTGEFHNTGSVGVSASFVVDIERGGRRVEVLGSDGNRTFVPVGQRATFEHVYRPSSGGDYTATGSVNFGLGSTSKLSQDFTVQDLSVFIVLAIIATVSILAILFTVFLKRRKNKASRQQVVQSTSQEG